MADNTRTRIIMGAFADYTSVPGLPRILTSRRRAPRVAWSVVLIVLSIAFAVEMTFVFQRYFKYPKKLVTDIMPNGVPFPDVTLCNLGSFDFYTAYKLGKGLEELGAIAERRHGSPSIDVKYSNDPFVRTIYKFQNVLNKTKLHSKHLQKYIDKMLSRTSLSANLPPMLLQENGFLQDEFIIKCTFGSKPCKFKKIFDPYHFNCYTFTGPNGTTASVNDGTNMLIEGMENGLTVVLLAGSSMLQEATNTGNDKVEGMYTRDSALAGSNGIRIVVHPPGTQPFPTTEGYDVPPGHMVSFGITPRQRVRLGEPYGRCSTTYPSLTDEEQKLARPYRKSACEKLCIQNHIYRECDCFKHTFPTEIDALSLGVNDTHTPKVKIQCENCFMDKMQKIANGVEIEDECWGVQRCSGTSDFRMCFNVYNNHPANCEDPVLLDLTKKIECADTVTERVISNATLLQECNCHPECNEFLYDVSYSLSQWPSRGMEVSSVSREIMNQLDFVSRITDPGKKKFYQDYVKTDLKQAVTDFTKITVYVTDTNVFRTTEEPAITTTQLISEFGGQLGAWIGVSIIPVFEILEALVQWILAIGVRKSRY